MSRYGQRARHHGRTTSPPAPSATTPDASTLISGLTSTRGSIVKATRYRAWTVDDLARWFTMTAKRLTRMSEVKVLGFLQWWATKHRKVTPARSVIAEKTGLCERTVSRATEAIAAAGAFDKWIDPAFRRPNGTYTRARTNLYLFKWPPNATNALVAPRGHEMHVKALKGSVVPAEPVEQPPLPDLEVPPAGSDEAETVVPPDWVRLGITLAEWLERHRR